MISVCCGFNNPPSAKFCCGCGSQILQASPPETQAERRVLSVVFCDIVGATSLSEQIDPEDFRSLLIGYHDTCLHTVEKFGGFLADLMGDGVVIYFGYPKAHEDDEIRSIRCALALLTAVQDLSARGRHPFDVRIGVHRGRVVVGALGGAAGTQSLAIGETPNLAARLQGEASAGQVVVSDSLWRLVSHTFHGQPLGARRLKGIQRPVEIHRVIAYRPASRYKSSAAAFVGRKQELNTFESLWQEVLTGQPRALLIRGEPGIGKSRLIHQLSRSLVEPNTTVMEAACSSFSTDTPYYPFREMLRNRLSLDGFEPDEQLERLRGRLAHLGLPLLEALPLLALFLELPIKPQEWAILGGLSLARQRQRTLDLLIQGLIALAEQSPLLLIVEDLHWADASTIELLDQLLNSECSARFLVVLSARLEFRSRWLEQPHVSEILLDALNAVEAETVIRDVAADKAMPSEVVRQICQRSSGNPLFLEEITLSVISSKSMVEREQTWELLQPLSADMVPASMEAALMARLDQLGESKHLLQIGATLGRDFSLDLLTAVVAIDTTRLQEMLSQLVDEGLLHISGATPPVYIFKHALVQDVAYHSLLRSTRQEHHSRIAKVLTEQFPEIPKRRPELLAHHLSGAGRYQEAAHHWQAAGQLAAERSAVNEAVDHLNRGLADLNQLPQEEGRWQHELDLHTALAPVQMAAYGWASRHVETTCLRAIDLALSIGSEDQHFAALWGLWSNQFVAGRLGEAIKNALKVQVLARSRGTELYTIPAFNATSYTRFFRAEFDEAIQQADQGISLFDNELERLLCRHFQLGPTTPIMTARSCSLWMKGQQVQGSNGMHEMLRLARSLNHPPTLAAGLSFMCHFLFYENDWQGLFSVSREVYKLASEEGFSMWRACSAMYHYHSCLQLGLADITIDNIVEKVELFRQTGSLVIDPVSSIILSSALHSAGRSQEALLESQIGQANAERDEVGALLPDLFRLRGLIYSDLGNVSEAEQAFMQAIDLARQQGAKSLELRALTNLVAHNLRYEGSVASCAGLRQMIDESAIESHRPDAVNARNLLANIDR
jgi:class 3 adenylate cyclase/tetratricopeptide (TPR) repeat protein